RDVAASTRGGVRHPKTRPGRVPALFGAPFSPQNRARPAPLPNTWALERNAPRPTSGWSIGR
ncbi:MAG: hypothetical protein SGJ21_14975, partial [Alphaproteobacteria bacterium]|nr:hypothetical protein [Alphaproteobacteria bacterium]